MMSTIENPKMSISDLNKLEELVKDNKANSIDYENLDKYLSFLGIRDFFITKLRENGIDDYEDFIHRRKSSPSSMLNMLVGTSLGIISVLKKYISGK